MSVFPAVDVDKITKDDKDRIIEWINKNAEKGIYFRKEDIYDRIKVAYPDISSKQFKNWLKNYMNDFRSIKIKVTETPRILLNESTMKKHLETLKSVIGNFSGELTGNVDEIGICPTMCKGDETYVMVPKTNSASPSTILYGVDKDIRRYTTIHCIFNDGSYTSPYILLPYKTMEKSLVNKFGMLSPKLIYQENGFSTIFNFFDWFSTMFVETINKRRRTQFVQDRNKEMFICIEKMKENKKTKEEIEEFTKQFLNETDYFLQNNHTEIVKKYPALLILDSCSSHDSHMIIEYAKLNNISLYYLPSHSSHISQPLDLFLFGQVKKIYKSTIHEYLSERMKIKKQIETKSNTEDHYTKKRVLHLIAVVVSLLGASTSQNIMYSFNRAGISSTFLNGCWMSVVNLEMATAYRKWFEVKDVQETNKDELDKQKTFRIRILQHQKINKRSNQSEKKNMNWTSLNQYLSNLKTEKIIKINFFNMVVSL